LPIFTDQGGVEATPSSLTKERKAISRGVVEDRKRSLGL